MVWKKPMGETWMPPPKYHSRLKAKIEVCGIISILWPRIAWLIPAAMPLDRSYTASCTRSVMMIDGYDMLGISIARLLTLYVAKLRSSSAD